MWVLILILTRLTQATVGAGNAMAKAQAANTRLDDLVARMATAEGKLDNLHGISNPSHTNDPVTALAVNNRFDEIAGDIRSATA